ncbi:hypothetical protein [Bacillus sp. SG-1]|uniref:hypothetical protein n=1 Tax=Bacillus sp. SG-1 TaxID=161544 RepID=UPI000154365B|nr:hypothetical protein [Bacillus sp. SG-1]EDL66696.1 Predicted membrane protein [Bacillus sp. SG-1]
MQIFATFDHSQYLEIAISKLEQRGITDIFAVPLDNRTEMPRLFDSLHRSDGISLINKGMFFAVLFAVIGASRGFILEWGPIYWGLIGAGSGFLLGFIIDLIQVFIKRKKTKLLKGKSSEVIMIINCSEEDSDEVVKILWDNLSLGVAKVK